MAATYPEPFSWPKRRFWWTIFFVFAVQVGAIFLLGERLSPAPILQNEKTHFRFVTRSLSAGEIFDNVLVGDPSLFVLPGKNDFSGPAWLELKATDYSPPDWDEPSRWLELDLNSLAETFVHYVQTNKSEPLEIAAQLLPRDYNATSEATVRTEQRSSLRIEGDLGKRRLLDIPNLPSLEHAEPIANTVLQLAVDGAGDVVTSRLLSPRSGDPGSLPAANQTALEITRNLRFKPVNNGPATTNLTWGRIIFRWQTMPLIKTNVASNTP